MLVLLPYDGSAVARAALAHLADRAHHRWAQGRLVLLLPAGSRCTVQRRRHEARRVAGPGVALTFALLAGDDLPAAVGSLARRLPRATFVAPLELRGVTPWYRAVVCAVLTGRYGRCMALHKLAHTEAPLPCQRTRAAFRARSPRRPLPGHCTHTTPRRCCVRVSSPRLPGWRRHREH